MVKIEVPVVTFEVKRSGIFDLDKLYKDMKQWYDDRGFTFHEKVHKFKPPELELEWEGVRKNTSYRMTVIEMRFHSWYHKDVKVKVKEKEKKMVEARFQIKLMAKVVYDYEKKFDTPFRQWLQKFFHKFVFYYQTHVIWPDMAYYELVDLQAKIKQSLESTIPGGAY